MSLLDVDSWSRECDACEALNKVILVKLDQRERRQRNSPEYNRLTSALQTELKQFDGEVKELQQKLELVAETQSIDANELAQRKQQVLKLQTQLAQVRRRVTSDIEWQREELLASTSGGQSSGAERISNYEDLKQRQIDILERQNRGLEALSETISRQKNLASQLGQEVEGQNNILDNLADTMERVDANVHLETGNISEVNRKDSTWGYWLVIITLFIAIIIVAVL